MAAVVVVTLVVVMLVDRAAPQWMVRGMLEQEQLPRPGTSDSSNHKTVCSYCCHIEHELVALEVVS